MIIAKNKSFLGTDKRYRGAVSSTSWTLCVGAGISFGFVPTWQDLTRRVLNSAFGSTFDVKTFQSFVDSTRWNYDAFLQGVANQLTLSGQPLEKFGEILEQHLYSDILEHAKNSGVEKELIEALNNPRVLKKDQIPKLPW